MCVRLSVLVFFQRHCRIEETKKRNVDLLGGGLVEIESRGRIIIRERDKEVQRI